MTHYPGAELLQGALFPAADAADLGLADSVLCSQFALEQSTLPVRTDSNHRGRGEFGRAMLLAMRSAFRVPLQPRTAFRVHVPHVVQLRSEEKVVRPDARRIVASVKDLFPFRYLPIGESPGNSMCVLLDAIRSTVAHSKDSVRTLASTASTSPQPTTFSPIDLCPESNFKGCNFSHARYYTAAGLQ